MHACKVIHGIKFYTCMRKCVYCTEALILRFWRGGSTAVERGYNPETPSNFWNNPKDSDIG